MNPMASNAYLSSLLGILIRTEGILENSLRMAQPKFIRRFLPSSLHKQSSITSLLKKSDVFYQLLVLIMRLAYLNPLKVDFDHLCDFLPASSTYLYILLSPQCSFFSPTSKAKNLCIETHSPFYKTLVKSSQRAASANGKARF